MDRNHPIVGFIENPLIWSDVEGWLRLLGGRLICSRGFPQVQKLPGREGGAIDAIDFEYWEDDGTSEYQRVSSRLESAGGFVERDEERVPE